MAVDNNELSKSKVTEESGLAKSSSSREFVDEDELSL